MYSTKMKNNDYILKFNSSEKDFYYGKDTKEVVDLLTDISENPELNKPRTLYLYGSAGCGKTHILKGFLNDYKKNHRDKKAFMLCAETFLNKIIESIRVNKYNRLLKMYSDIDLLIVDHFSNMGNKSATFIEINNLAKQIIKNGGLAIYSLKNSPEHSCIKLEEFREDDNTEFISMGYNQYPSNKRIIREYAQQNNIQINNHDTKILARRNFDIRKIHGIMQMYQFYYGQRAMIDIITSTVVPNYYGYSGY